MTLPHFVLQGEKKDFYADGVLENRKIGYPVKFEFGEGSELIAQYKKAASLGMYDIIENLYSKYSMNDDLFVGNLTHNDVDGDGCYQVLKRYFKHGPTVYKNINYNTDLSGVLIRHIIESSEILFITDLSLSEDQIRFIMEEREKCKQMGPVIWIDHHKSSVLSTYTHENLYKFNYGVIGVAATTLVYLWCIMYYKIIGNPIVKTDDIMIPPAVLEIGLYDTFHECMRKQFNYGMTARFYDFYDFDIWDMVMDGVGSTRRTKEERVADNIQRVLSDGDVILNFAHYDAHHRYETTKEEVDIILIKDCEIFETAQCVMANAYGFSDLFGSDFKKYDGCCKFYKSETGSWTHSFYADKDKERKLNCFAVCKLYGGGGHPTASGFESNHPVSSKATINKTTGKAEILIDYDEFVEVTGATSLFL
ncbi:MAG: hypothetical protein IKA36_00740 [Clostridia bacterium]|nr:hypothetical protein [Clostridia bacterium]